MSKVESLDSQIKHSLERILCLVISGGHPAKIAVHVDAIKEHDARRAVAVAMEGGKS